MNAKFRPSRHYFFHFLSFGVGCIEEQLNFSFLNLFFNLKRSILDTSCYPTYSKKLIKAKTCLQLLFPLKIKQILHLVRTVSLDNWIWRYFFQNGRQIKWGQIVFYQNNTPGIYSRLSCYCNIFSKNKNCGSPHPPPPPRKNTKKKISPRTGPQFRFQPKMKHIFCSILTALKDNWILAVETFFILKGQFRTISLIHQKLQL